MSEHEVGEPNAPNDEVIDQRESREVIEPRTPCKACLVGKPANLNPRTRPLQNDRADEHGPNNVGIDEEGRQIRQERESVMCPGHRVVIVGDKVDAVAENVHPEYMQARIHLSPNRRCRQENRLNKKSRRSACPNMFRLDIERLVEGNVRIHEGVMSDAMGGEKG